jgi:hypothetical protein
MHDRGEFGGSFFGLYHSVKLGRCRVPIKLLPAEVLTVGRLHDFGLKPEVHE